jgi:hypothetical protein
MPTKATIGQLLVNESLPEQYRDYNRVLDGKTVQKILQDIAEKDPDSYKPVLKKLFDVGRDVAYTTGGFSFGLDSLSTAVASKKTNLEIRAKVKQIQKDPTLDDKAKNDKIIETVLGYQSKLEKDIMDESKAEHNPLALQVLSGSRGKPSNLKSLRGGDLLYTDHRDRAIPIPVLNSFSSGLTPAEYFAGSFGARKGVVDTKFAVQHSGFFSKQLNQLGHRLIVTAKDADDDEYTVNRGMPVEVDDPDNEGALLAIPVGPYKRNTVLTPRVMKALEDLGVKKIAVRSPVAMGSPDGGLYARDVGIRERGGLPGTGDFVGIAAAQALGEPISQGTLCLAEGTLVRMADWSVKPLEEVRPDEWVMGSDRNGVLKPVKVLNFYDNGLKPCVRTTFNVSMTKESVELVSTADHKLLANARRWDPKTELSDYGIWPVNKKCVRLCAFMPREVDHDGGSVNEPMALLIGLLLGDGCYTESVHGVHLSCFDPSLIEDITPYLANFGLKARLLSGQKGYYRISQIKDTIAQDTVTGRTLPGDRNPALVKLKQLKLYGKYAHEKTLPEEVWSWDKESVLQLLAGLIATDGSVYTSQNRKAQEATYVGYGSTSLPLIEQIKEILKVRFAIWPSKINDNNLARKRTLHSFCVSRQQDVLALSKLLLPYLPGKKKLLLAKVAEGFTSWRDTRFFYRKKQVSVGELRTYDIEVDSPDHLFVLANGLIVSNSSKHSGGVAGGKSISGFKVLNQLIQSPKHSPYWATHAQADGKIDEIKPAPTGGYFLTIKGINHYVNPDAAISYKVGDEIEAGDMLTDGVPNPSEFVRHKGLGEGRRQFVTAFRKSMQEAGLGANRRNIEVLSRGLINHIRLTDEVGESMPDDVIPYDMFERSWKPREGYQTGAPKNLRNKYLERPTLHYSVGTRITPSVIKELDDFNIKEVTAHQEPPPFEPHFLRGLDNLQYDPDWMTRMLGSNLQKGTLKSVWAGGISDESGTSFVPSLAKSVGFGHTGKIKGFDPKEVIKPAIGNGGVL